MDSAMPPAAHHGMPPFFPGLFAGNGFFNAASPFGPVPPFPQTPRTNLAPYTSPVSVAEGVVGEYEAYEEYEDAQEADEFESAGDDDAEYAAQWRHKRPSAHASATDRPKRKRVCRFPYRCRHCGRLKKGHVCKVVTAAQVASAQHISAAPRRK